MMLKIFQHKYCLYFVNIHLSWDLILRCHYSILMMGPGGYYGSWALKSTGEMDQYII